MQGLDICFAVRSLTLGVSIKLQKSMELCIPKIVREAIMPTFQELSDDTHLKRCLHGFAQNNNESINDIIWKRLPNDVFVGRTVIEIGICSAVVCFNDDAVGVSKIFEELSMDTGQFTKSFCLIHDTPRVKIMDRKSSDEGRLRRKMLRAVRKGWQDKKYRERG